MLVAEDLSKVIITALQSAPFPTSGRLISNAIRSYVQSNGVATPPTISYVLSPCSGAGWEALIPLASSSGVIKHIISVGISQEFGGSTKVIPAPHGVQTVPMIFNRAAMVTDLSTVTDFNKVWLEISKAIVEFFKPEIK